MNTHQVDTASATGSLPHWRPVLVAAAVAQILFNVVVMVVSGEAVPPVIALSVLLAIGLSVLVNRPRAGAAILGVISLLHLVTSAVFLAEGLVHPESFWDFWLGWSIVLAALLGVVAAIPVWRQKDLGSGRARAVSLAVGSLIVALGIAGGAASAAYESDSPLGGDIALAARNVEFEPAKLSTEGERLPCS